MRILASLALLLGSGSALAHGTGSLGAAPLDWHTDEVARVVTQAAAFGNLGFLRVGAIGEVVEVEGRRCLRGTLFNVDVRDDLAFDIDETVRLELELDLGSSAHARIVSIVYDQNGSVAGVATIEVPDRDGDRFHVESIDLERARFAGRGDFGTDLTILAGPASSPFAGPNPMTICGLRVIPSFTTRAPEDQGWLELTVFDERGEPTPARLGLYDASGRTPLPSSSALEVEEFDDRTRMVLLRQEPGTRNWPSANRWVFYTDGEYRARLPVGEYDLVVAKGIEYRVAQRTIRIEPDETRELAIMLERFADLPSDGWYSGDVHIHMAQRDDADSRSILTNARAEDLHVANSLQMGNMGATHFAHRAWGRDAWQRRGDYAVVPGQEDPRTGFRGHTIHLDIPEPVRDPSRYLLYHETFERVATLGGLSGYAHIGAGTGNTLGGNVGLALEVPFGLVDFVEVLQAGGLGTDLWFEFLNLGFRIAPAAGSDYPYIGHVGEVRTYVQLPGAYAPDAWFENLAAGRAFVTNGPLLRLTLNDASIGAQLSLARGDAISIAAEASLNPDIDVLERLVLIEQGEVVAEASSTDGAETLRLEHETRAEHGSWFVVRATGRTRSDTLLLGSRAVEAVSAPIYVTVDGERTWKRADVRRLVETRKTDLAIFSRLAVAGSNLAGAESWQDAELLRADGPRQLGLLEARIEEANARYDELVRLAE